jgi:pilus assembly protein Flp/PilA
MTEILRSLRKDTHAATMVEYAIMLALIAVVCVAAVGVVGTRANNSFTTSGNSLPSGS